MRRPDRIGDVAARLCLADRSDHRQSGHADGTRSAANHVYDRREPCFRCDDRHGSSTARHISASCGHHRPQSGRHRADAAALAVLPVPTTAVIKPDARTIIQRSLYRLVGCSLGALLGLFFLYWVVSNFLVWLLLLMAGTWLSSQIQSGSTGIGYVGTQVYLAFLLSMIQGQGPPLSPTPGLDRFAGIMAGLSLLLVITMVVSLFRFAPPTASPASGDLQPRSSTGWSG